jgi:hypothetical protein
MPHNKGMTTSSTLTPDLLEVMDTAYVSIDPPEAVLRVHRGMDRTKVWTIAAHLLHTASLYLAETAPAGTPASRFSTYSADGWSYLTFRPKTSIKQDDRPPTQAATHPKTR